MSELTCPREERRRVLSAFSSECRKRRLKAKPSHPMAVVRVWHLAGGHLGKITSGCERVVRQAAAMGLSELDLTTVANRWGV